ncbi:hypothetical protein [Desulfoglaeba alkanexedens]|uniref:Glycosyl hydrolase family 32 N-terminal domain-containing protein n=1 Tax=Desulfoglaeba alkanexedens ALDC TaxID=980445 RepID=A0A4P8L2M3_9BACT|nr:hypothetical protein [Desulfoglaeba alkanexedens]QCQ22079.1 hypothetical protein FDQ92_07800 [Desulfoglaeba alkanexedens ALDC]
MSINIKSNTDTILELPGFTGTLGPGKSAVVPAMTPDLLRAVDLGLLLVPSGAEPPEGLPPVVFDHRYPHVLPLTAGRAYYVRILRSPGAFHDGTRPRNFIAYYGDGAGTTCAFSDDGLIWDTEKKVTGIAANGYHVVCALETANRLRILYWNPDVPNQPYAMAGLRTAVCDPSVDPAAFTGDTPCAGDLVTEGSVQVWNRGHYGPSFLWYNPLPTSVEGRPFTWRYAMYFIASTGGNDSLGLACSDDAVEWKLIGNGPILSGLIDPQPWEGANGYVSAAHVERLPDGRWWMLYSGGSAGNAGIGYAWSWDRVHWRKAEINPVFKNGSGPFLERCYTPSLVRDADGSLLLYRAAKDATAYRTFVSRLRAPALGWGDLLGPDRLGQGLTSREAIHRGVGTETERDAAIPNPSMGDEWFNTDLAGGGKWEKHTGTDWKWS